MKTKIYSMMFVLVLFFGMSQGAMAKKVTYLGHQYKGDVNKEKVPYGEGMIFIDGRKIVGLFNGNTVTQATIACSDIKFEGEVTFNETNNITLKAGGKLTKYYYTGDQLKPSKFNPNASTKEYVYREDVIEYQKQTYEILSEDIEIDRMLTKSPFIYTFEMKMINVPNSLNPPLIKYSINIPLKTYELRTKNTLTYLRDIDIYLIPEKLVYKNINITNYKKDEQGRVWSYNPSTREYKVTYPDGSYYAENGYGNVGNDYRDIRVNWKVFLADNVTVEGIRYHGGEEKEVIHMKNKIVVVKGQSVDDFIQINESKTIPQKEEIQVKFTDRDMRTLSDEQVEKIIKEEIIPVFGEKKEVEVLSDFAEYMHQNYSEYGIGEFRDGHYMSKVTKKAAEKAERDREKAERDREKAAEENALKADRNKFKAKYGFDPISGSAFKVGRTTDMVDAWNSWLKSHGYIGFTFKLKQDHGASKCLRIYSNGKAKGSIWVRNKTITSVVWY